MSKKLLIVSRSTVFHNKSGGMETQLSNLIKALSKDFEITILSTALSVNQKITKTEIYGGVKYIFLKDTIPGEYGANLYENLFWQIPIKRSLSQFGKNFRSKAAAYFESNLKNNFNFILSQSSAANNFNLNKDQKLVLVYHGTTLNELKSRLSGLKSIKDYIRFIGLDFPTLLFEYIVKNTFLFYKSYKIVLVSKLIKKDFEKQYPLFKNKIEIIPNSIDTSFFKSAKKSKEFKVIYYGRIDFEKGLDSFIEVSEKVKDAEFEVYGDGIDRNQFEGLLKNKKLNNLKYLGAVDNSTIQKVLSHSNCFLFLTKRKEGFPMSVLEALATENLIITTMDLSLINKEIPFVRVKNVKEAIEALNTYIHNLNKMSNLTTRGRKLVTTEYSLDSLSEKFKKILR